MLLILFILLFFVYLLLLSNQLKSKESILDRVGDLEEFLRKNMRVNEERIKKEIILENKKTQDYLRKIIFLANKRRK